MNASRRPPTRPTDPQRRADAAREDAARAVLRSVRHGLERGAFSKDDVVEVAMVQLLRPGRPGARLSATARDTLRAGLHQLAEALDVSQPRSLLAFARAAADAALAMIPPPRHPGATIDVASRAGAAELARAAVWAEATHARDPDDHVQRAVTRALRERRKGRGLKSVPLADDDPLRAVLDVPSRGRVVLPRTDLRIHMASAADGTALGQALRQAARFSEELIRDAVGEELWSLCRPVAFANKDETRVLVQVRSALMAHEVQLRSQELVHRLRTVPGLAQLAGIKIVVEEPAKLPVVSGRPRGMPR